MNTREIADKLGTDPKRLRRFLRSDVTYRNAGQGGRYEFTDRDVPTLKKRFDAWDAAASAKTTERPRKTRRSTTRVDEPMPDYIASKPASKLTTAEREERDRRSRERVDRLEARLKASGLHISQSSRRERV